MIGPMGLCHICRHWTENDDDDIPVCTAYPDGIPQQIMRGRMDHTRTQAGDHGVLFELEDGADPATAERILARMRS